MHIAINTPNGNIGRPLTERLLAGGASVTMISRSPEKVRDLVRAGARLVLGSIDDQAVVDEALRGADALFWLTPPAYRPEFRGWAKETAENAAKTAKRHGTSRAVLLSSIGAQHGKGTGPVDALHSVEAVFEAEIDHTVHSGRVFSWKISCVTSLR